jgi:uncharacterized damage-inducible protein DinB
MPGTICLAGRAADHWLADQGEAAIDTERTTDFVRTLQETLQGLYAYNTWANAQVFDLCRGVDQAQLDQDAPGTAGTISETLKHMVGVEVVYAHMLRNGAPDDRGSREEFFAHDVAWFGERAAEVGREYADLLAGAGEAFYDEPLDVPWFDFVLTKHDGLFQVLAHSAQHRAQVLSVLGQRGVEVPDVDYVLFVESQGAPKK